MAGKYYVILEGKRNEKKQKCTCGRYAQSTYALVQSLFSWRIISITKIINIESDVFLSVNLYDMSWTLVVSLDTV